MNQELASNLSIEFTKFTKINCEVTFYKRGEEHKPTTLPENKKGVYVFLKDGICFKVGKANSNSRARWNSHHYSLDKSTPSTLTKSILNNLDVLKKYFKQEEIENFISILEKYNLTQKNIKQDLKKLDKTKVKDLSKELNLKQWIHNNMDRIEFLIDNTDDEVDFDTNLLEALIQFKLKPIFEGKNA